MSVVSDRWEHPVAAAVAEVGLVFDGVARSALWAVADDQLPEVMVAAGRAVNRLQGLLVRLVAELDERELPTRLGASSTAALDPLSGPRPDAAGGPDRRSAAERRADALIEVARRCLAAGDLPERGGQRPHVAVTIPLRALTDRVGHATTDTGEILSPTAARMLACDCAVLPAVLGGAGQVIELGHSQRLFTGALRKALVLRDRGCGFPGCDRPPAWCDGHHIVHWADGGTTSLTNAVLLCGRHHTVVHRDGWTIALATDGIPEFTPPPWADPTGTPQRNHRPG